MRYLQVSVETLAGIGFSRPAQANSFFPPRDPRDHIHLGVPVRFDDGGTTKFAEPGNVFLTYISLKRDGAFWFQFNHDPESGYFSFPRGLGPGDLPADWWIALEYLGVIRG